MQLPTGNYFLFLPCSASMMSPWKKMDHLNEDLPTLLLPSKQTPVIWKIPSCKNWPPISEHWIKKFLLHSRLVHKQLLSSYRLLKLLFFSKNLKEDLGLQWFVWNSNGYNWGVFRPILLDSVNALLNITAKHTMKNVSSISMCHSAWFRAVLVNNL